MDQLSEKTQDVILTAAATRVEEFDTLFLVAVSARPVPSEQGVLRALFEGMESGFLLHTENRSKPENEHLWHFKVGFSLSPRPLLLFIE